MKFASLGSGSRGNATLIAAENTLILLDCGFTLRETEKRCARLGVNLENLTAVLLTHEHSDHSKGIGPIARKYAVPVFMTNGSYLSRDYGNIPNLNFIQGYRAFSVGNLHITPVAVPHDAKEPAQFIFENSLLRFGVLTDLGSATPHVIESYADCHAYLIEFNHDLQMLNEGPYPPQLKRRVASLWGHLNNEQAASLLQAVISDSTRHLVVAHISQQNNTQEKAAAALSRALQYTCNRLTIQYASQDAGVDWINLSK